MGIDYQRTHFETTIEKPAAGRSAFDGLVTCESGELVKRLYELKEGDLRVILLERVLAERSKVGAPGR